MGNKQELLVSVRQPEGKEGTTEVALITDVAAGVTLHWGVKKGQSGDWVLPSKDLWPTGSKVSMRSVVNFYIRLGCPVHKHSPARHVFSRLLMPVKLMSLYAHGAYRLILACTSAANRLCCVQDAGTGIAIDTPFDPMDSEEADSQPEGKKVPLQQARLTIPAGHDLNALTFVIRSDDSTSWWRDGAGLLLFMSPPIMADISAQKR